MAHDSINLIMNIGDKVSINRLVHFAKHSTSIVFKGLLAKCNERRPSTTGIMIIESPDERALDKEMKAGENSTIFLPSADNTYAARTAYDLSDDLVMLAAQNKAFKEGLLQLQALNLDEDLFIEAVQALRIKYYSQRNPIISHYQSSHDGSLRL